MSKEHYAEYPITSAKEFVRLRDSQIPQEYEQAAYRPISASVCREIIENYPEMKKWVIHNKTVPMEILEELSSDKNVNIRDAVLGKKNSVTILEKLSSDPEPHIRFLVAGKPNTALDILKRLAMDPEPNVRIRAQRRLNNEDYLFDWNEF